LRACAPLPAIALALSCTLLAGCAAAADGAASAASSPATPVTTASGLVFESVKDGTGPSPRATDVVTVHYRGTLLAGTEFDSSYKRNAPASFPLSRVIPCWTEGLQRMKVGGKARLTCPPEIAYGTRGAGGVIPPNATLRFEVELLKVGTP
jgi:FKBP-type peptidyl-prolyl cis-trans isomerase FkpA